MIDSSDSIHFTLDTIVDNDCADHLSKLIGYDYLLVPNEYYDEVEDPRSKNFREYRVMLSVNINLNDINLLI
jgi:Cft2 family RNA processing exonuclease